VAAAADLPQKCPPLEQATRRWRWHHIAIWLFLFALVVWWRGPSYRRALRPDYFPDAPSLLLLPDFFQEWASARNWLEGLPVYTPQEATAARYLGLHRMAGDRGFIEYNAHPPAAVLPGLPVAKLPFASAFVVWNALSLVMLAVSGWLMVHQLKFPWSPWDLVPACTLLLLCRPFEHQMIHGQLNPLLLLLLTGAWAADRTGRPRCAGALVGIAAAIKLFPGFVFVYFLARRQWRSVAAGVLTLAALGGLTAIMFGLESYRSYLHEVLH